MSNALNNQFYGLEPQWEGVRFPNDVEKDCAIAKALNWYNAISEGEDHKKWLIQYLKTKSYPLDTIENISKIHPDDISIAYGQIPGLIGFNTGVIARLLTLGAPLAVSEVETLSKAIEYLNGKANKPKPVGAVAKPSVQERIENHFPVIVDFLELKCDQILKSTYVPVKKSIKPVFIVEIEKYIADMKGVYCPMVIDHYTPLLTEVSAAIGGSDPELAEGYSGLNPENLKSYQDALKTIINSCSLKIDVIKSTPVFRKRRKKAPVDVVKKLQYKREDPEFGLTSVLASKMVDKQRLLVFNTKYRKITLFEAGSVHGLSVKGTTIIGFDPKLSRTKTLRKPKEFFAKIKDGGIRVVRKAFDELKVKESPAKGRINEDCILVGVFD